MAAWGLTNGQYEPASLVAACKLVGAGWLSLQATLENEPYAAELRDRCHRRGMRYGIWMQDVSNPSVSNEAIRRFRPDFYQAAVEGPGNWRAWLANFRVTHPAMQLGLVTNFSGCGAMPDGTYNAAEARPWQTAGAYLQPEAYVCQNPQATPDNLDWTAKTHLGWKASYPVIGIYNGWDIADYAGLLRNFSRFGIYAAEYLSG